MKSTEKARFDTRLAKEQKDFFEYAAGLGGFRNLTDFVLYALNEKAKQIVAEHNLILASQRDQQIFFEAIMNEPLPNDALKLAASRYQQALDA